MKRTRSIDEANLMDDVFFNIVASDPDEGDHFCRKLLSVLLEKDIANVTVVAQRVLTGIVPEVRGVRLDVEITEHLETSVAFTSSVYDIEPHREKEPDLPKMLRFRQSKIDSRHMKKSDNDFSHLPDLYVILITDFDPFGEGYMLYTIHNKCDEIPTLEYKDGLKYLFFNTKGKKGGSTGIENMLGYIKNSRIDAVVDDATSEIDRYVQNVREDPAVRGKYMTFGDKLDREKREGIIIGDNKRLIVLICKKLAKGKTISEIAEDLETDEEEIAPIFNIAVRFAPDYDSDLVFKEMYPDED